MQQRVAPIVHPAIQTERFTQSKFLHFEEMSGVLSYDKRLHGSVDELSRFFQIHNTKPSMTLKVKGHHRMREEYVEDRAPTVHAEDHAGTVTDFEYEFDLSGLVSPEGNMQSAFVGGNGHSQTLTEVLEEFIQSKSSLKEIAMMKFVDGFDALEVKRSVASHLRNELGYGHTIEVKMEYRDNCVRVVSPTAIARLYQMSRNSSCLSFLCLLSCSCIIWYPVMNACSRKEDIRSSFKTTTNATTWLQANLHRLHCDRKMRNPLGGDGAWDCRKS